MGARHVPPRGEEGGEREGGEGKKKGGGGEGRGGEWSDLIELEIVPVAQGKHTTENITFYLGLGYRIEREEDIGEGTIKVDMSKTLRLEPRKA